MPILLNLQVNKFKFRKVKLFISDNSGNRTQMSWVLSEADLRHSVSTELRLNYYFFFLISDRVVLPIAPVKTLSYPEFHYFSLHKWLICTWKNLFYIFIYILLSLFENLNAKSLKAGVSFILFTTISSMMTNHPSLLETELSWMWGFQCSHWE